MTRYIAAYDTESAKCPAACEQIVKIHREFEMPATFFIVGRHLLDNAKFYRDLLTDPLFEIASHTWSHQLLKEHPIGGAAQSGQKLADEILKGKDAVQEVFERPCLGMRPGYSFEDALHNAPQVLKLVKQAGYRYISSQAWGPGYTLPAPLNQPHTYEADGYPDLWELPCHGWHDNVLNGLTPSPKRPFAVTWPIENPALLPLTPVQTPAAAAAVNCAQIDAATQQSLPFVSLIWHPWSIGTFDPEMQMLRQIFTHVKQSDLQVGTYADLFDDCTTPAFSSELLP